MRFSGLLYAYYIPRLCTLSFSHLSNGTRWSVQEWHLSTLPTRHFSPVPVFSRHCPHTPSLLLSEWDLLIQTNLNVFRKINCLNRTCLKTTAFRDIAPCRLVEADRLFRGAYCLHHQGGERPPLSNAFFGSHISVPDPLYFSSINFSLLFHVADNK
jgi:hypothetical protein